jgi:hypothetical protein
MFAVTLTIGVIPVPAATATTGSASFAYGPTTQYGRTTPSVAVPWGSGAGATTVSATMSGLSYGTSHYMLTVTSPSGEQLSQGDQTISIPPPPCPLTLPTHRVSVRWSLAHLGRSHRTASVRYRVPCGTARVRARITTQRHGVVTLAVIATIDSTVACVSPRSAPARAMTVRLPHPVSRARLQHGPVTTTSA